MAPEWVAAAVAVAANFQMMNRILDATGVPVNPRFAPTGIELGFTEQDWTRPASTADATATAPASAPSRAPAGPSGAWAVA